MFFNSRFVCVYSYFFYLFSDWRKLSDSYCNGIVSTSIENTIYLMGIIIIIITFWKRLCHFCSLVL